MISYDPLWMTLIKQKRKKQDLYNIVSSSTVARMGKDNQAISVDTIDKLCSFLGCDITDVIEYRPNAE